MLKYFSAVTLYNYIAQKYFEGLTGLSYATIGCIIIYVIAFAVGLGTF